MNSFGRKCAKTSVITYYYSWKLYTDTSQESPVYPLGHRHCSTKTAGAFPLAVAVASLTFVTNVFILPSVYWALKCTKMYSIINGGHDEYRKVHSIKIRKIQIFLLDQEMFNIVKHHHNFLPCCKSSTFTKMINKN